MIDIQLRSESLTPLTFDTVDNNFSALADPLNRLAAGTFTDAGTITGTEIVPLAGNQQTTTGKITLAAQTTANTALGTANAASTALAGIANGAATDAGTLTGAETFPVSRGAGLLQSTLTKVSVFLNTLWLNQRLLQWAYATSFRLATATRNSNEAIVTASIVWPDGATGTFTTDTFSTAFPGAIDAWRATYVNGSISRVVIQPAVTRDTNGGVTAQPAITVT